jgi:hypothetical protein
MKSKRSMIMSEEFDLYHLIWSIRPLDFVGLFHSGRLGGEKDAKPDGNKKCIQWGSNPRPKNST